MAMAILHISKEKVLSAYSRSYNRNKTTSVTTISSFAEPDHSLNCHQELRLSHQMLSTSQSPSELRRKASTTEPFHNHTKVLISKKLKGDTFEERGQEQ